MLPSYHPAVNEIPHLDEYGINNNQDIIGVLRQAIEIGRVDLLLDVALFSTHLAMSRKGHLEQVYHTFGYLKQSFRRRLFFDPEHPDICGESFTGFNW